MNGHFLLPSKGRLKKDFSKNQNQRISNIPCSLVILKSNSTTRLDIYAVFFGNDNNTASIRNNTTTFKNPFFEWPHHCELVVFRCMEYKSPFIWFLEKYTCQISITSWKILFDKLFSLRNNFLLYTFFINWVITDGGHIIANLLHHVYRQNILPRPWKSKGLKMPTVFQEKGMFHVPKQFIFIFPAKSCPEPIFIFSLIRTYNKISTQ